MWNIIIFLKSCRGPPPPPFDLSEKFQHILGFLTFNFLENVWNRLIPEISATLMLTFWLEHWYFPQLSDSNNNDLLSHALKLSEINGDIINMNFQFCWYLCLVFMCYVLFKSIKLHEIFLHITATTFMFVEIHSPPCTATGEQFSSKFCCLVVQ